MKKNNRYTNEKEFTARWWAIYGEEKSWNMESEAKTPYKWTDNNNERGRERVRKERRKFTAIDTPMEELTKKRIINTFSVTNIIWDNLTCSATLLDIYKNCEMMWVIMCLWLGATINLFCAI